MSSRVDFSFAVTDGAVIPADHGYSLYGAISRLIPWVHETTNLGIHPIRGRQVGGRRLQVTKSSRVALRCLAEDIPQLLPLAGKLLVLDGAKVRLGVPSVLPLQLATSLRSRLVTIKLPGELTLAEFEIGLAKQLHALGTSNEVIATVPCRDSVSTNAHTNSSANNALESDSDSQSSDTLLPVRRTLRIKDKEIVGYEVILEGLTAEESLCIQHNGLGGRRKMGCGVFVPHQREAPK